MLLVGAASLTLLIYLLVSFLISFTLHETAHAAVAYLLGDPTAKEQGRLTLNPLAHLDRLGTLLILTVGLGWGKPVPVNPFRFRDVPPKVGMGIVALAGPVTNFALAVATAVPLLFKLLPFTAHLLIPVAWDIARRKAMGALLGVPWQAIEPLLSSWGELAAWFFWLNVSLAAFNLIPFGPLDGSRILAAFMPDWWFYGLARIELPLLGVFFGVILADRFFFQGTILGNLITPVGCFFWNLWIPYSSPLPFCSM
ncbi:MAG TPA: site-2 protease family protein [Ardenticatenaceae bacterium]|nr:site-2 protease family protein [Ardenticatenaceae bacterium]